MKLENEIANLRAYAGALRESVNGQSMMATSPQEVASHIEVFTNNVEIAADIEIGNARLEGCHEGMELEKMKNKLVERVRLAEGLAYGLLIGIVVSVAFGFVK